MGLKNNKILRQLSIAKAENKKQLAVLVDPDKVEESDLLALVQLCQKEAVDYFLVGGSLLHSNHFESTITFIKSHCNIPIVIFPGSYNQISPNADGILFLSLISGRNADYLIGNQVIATPLIKQYQLPTISTGYMLIESGSNTTALYVSGSNPIPREKPEIAATTALAGQYLGLQSIYLDAGSGAKYNVPYEMIKSVSDQIDIPLIVGGGINTGEKAYYAYQAGADMLVIGTSIEKNPLFLSEISAVKSSFNKSVKASKNA